MMMDLFIMEYTIFIRSNLKYLIESKKKKKKEDQFGKSNYHKVYKISTESMIINMNIIVQDIVHNV